MVRCDADHAELLTYRLLSLGRSVFWDRKDLLDGHPWEDGFTQGLARSRRVVALISSDGLDGIRSNVLAGRIDNVLLEYELAVERLLNDKVT